jgi:gliding motility-associated-like protein
MSDTQKYGNLFRSALIMILILVCGSPIFGQGDLPDKPDMIRVTVDHADNGILIQWESSTDTDIKYYNVYQMVNRTGTFLVSVPPNVFEYKHLNSGLDNLAYTVTAEDSTSNESLLGDNEHSAVMIEVEFDPCTPSNMISWTEYVGWENRISAYRIYGGPSGQPLTLLWTELRGELTWEHKEITVGEVYEYYIETVNISGLTSLSAIVSVESVYPEAPQYLEVDYVSVVDQSTVEIQFSADIGGPINDYRVMRRSNPGTPYTEVSSIFNPGQATQVVQDQVQTSVNSFQYAVQSIYQPGECSSPLLISESLPRPNILLQGFYENQMTTLTWTPYQAGMADISGYIIQRKKDEVDFITVETGISPETGTWREHIETFLNGHQLGEIQYRVIAVGVSGGYGNPGESVSNVVDIHIETNMQVPNAFTPESGDINSLFKPILDFAPKKFSMVIYDRAGRKLFESSDPGYGWDGRFGDGNFVDEGIYVYYIQYTDYTGLFKTMTGNVTVLYP